MNVEDGQLGVGGLDALLAAGLVGNEAVVRARVLSRNSLLGQRMRPTLLVAGVHGSVDGPVERVDILEGLVSKMMSLEVYPFQGLAESGRYKLSF